MLVVIDNIFW